MAAKDTQGATRAPRKTQRKNNIHWSTTVTPLHFALAQGVALTAGQVMIGNRVSRGHLADFTMKLVEDYFAEKYKMPYLLLSEILEESGVLETMDGLKLYPLEDSTIQAVVDGYNQRLVNYMYGTQSASGAQSASGEPL